MHRLTSYKRAAFSELLIAEIVDITGKYFDPNLGWAFCTKRYEDIAVINLLVIHRVM